MLFVLLSLLSLLVLCATTFRMERKTILNMKVLDFRILRGLLNGFYSEGTVHIYFKKANVLVCNFKSLFKYPYIFIFRNIGFYRCFSGPVVRSYVLQLGERSFVIKKHKDQKFPRVSKSVYQLIEF